MKKFLSLFISILFVISLVPVSTFAAISDGVISISSAEGYAGDEVEISFKLTTDVEWSTIGFVVEYDDHNYYWAMEKQCDYRTLLLRR